MKLLLGLLILIVGYYAALCTLTNLAVEQVAGIHSQYSAVAAAADQWQQGNTTVSLTGKP